MIYFIFESEIIYIVLHPYETPYETAEALCRRRNKVSAAAKWQVVGADSRWYGPAMISNGRDGLFKGILVYTYESVMNLLSFEMLHPFKNLHKSVRDDIVTSL